MIGKIIKDRDGSATMEFALALPLVLLLVFGYIFFMKGVETNIIMDTAAREGARAYANPIHGIDMRSYGIGVAENELNSNNIEGAKIDAYAYGYDRIVMIERPFSTRFPLNSFTLTSYSVFRIEPFDKN